MDDANESPLAKSVYARARILVVVMYVVSIVATVVVAAPADEKTNQIGARILTLDGDMVVGRYFVITNESRSHWYDVTIAIDGGYEVHKDLVRARERITLFLKDFGRDETTSRLGKDITRRVSAPLDFKVSAVTVRTRDGAARSEIVE
ncbi:MAG: hypothetical protein H7Z43_03260 [Clostridia bacterium]|nr:hypothetical protein [Deltaproteobacteria bacterium]